MPVPKPCSIQVLLVSVALRRCTIGAAERVREDLIAKSIPELKASIEQGVKFVADNP